MTNETTPKIRVGIDLDGVIYNFVDEFRSLMETTKDKTYPGVSRWDFYLDWGMTYEEYFHTVAVAAIGGKLFKDGNMYPGAAHGMKRLRELGCEVVIITARNYSTNPDHMIAIRKNTENWLDANDIIYDELIIDDDKTKHNLDILIDDGIHNVEAIARSGRIGFVFDRPWNHGSFYTRIMNWDDLVLRMTEINDRVATAYLQTSSL